MSRLKRVLAAGVISGLVMSGLALVPVGVLGLAAKKGSEYWNDLPSELNIQPSPQRSEVYASDNKTLLAVFYNENRKDVPLSQISPVMQKALISSEDVSFYHHHGWDAKGILRAFVSDSQGGSTQGASTITMQYVRQALTYYATSPEQIVKATEDTPQRKIREIKYATVLEGKYTKDQILDMYLNIAYFGHGAYGIFAASEVYFNTAPSRLTFGQAALLAGLVQAPTYYDPATAKGRPRALERRRYVLTQMVKTHALTQTQADTAIQETLKFYGKSTPEGCTSTYQVSKLGSGFFCDYLYRWWLQQPQFGKNIYSRQASLMQGGWRIVSTLDVKTQIAAHRYARNQPKEVSDSQRVSLHSSNANMLVAIQPGTGKVLAMGINRDFSNKKSATTTTLPLMSNVPGFQFGSSFKMFTLLAALNAGYKPSYTFDAPQKFVSKYVVSSGDCAPYYCVTNSSDSDVGPADMYRAFGKSINTYFVPLEQRIGAQNAVNMAKKLGISFSARGTKNNPSDYEFAHNPELSRSWGPFTLGISQTTSLEMASAYSTVVAGGKYCLPVPISVLVDREGKKITIPSKCSQVISKNVAEEALDIARCPVGGITKQSGSCNGATAPYAHDFVGRNVFGKTGTTDNSSSAALITGTSGVVVAGIQADPQAPLHPRVIPNHPSINYAVVATVRDSGK